MNIKITDKALGRFKKNLDQRSDAIGLRISITASGCNGYSYVLDYATEVEPTDEV